MYLSMSEFDVCTDFDASVWFPCLFSRLKCELERAEVESRESQHQLQCRFTAELNALNDQLSDLRSERDMLRLEVSHLTSLQSGT